MMPPQLEEQEPGVYVRNSKADQDLDFLWSGERKKTTEQDRFHFGFFIGGFIAGSLITLLFSTLYFTGGQLFASKNTPEPATIIEEQVLTTEDLGNPDTASEPQAISQESKGFSLPFIGGGAKAEKPTEETTAAVQAEPRIYKVQSGDTLGSIAIRYYGSSAPAHVEKIQQANGMDSPDTLKLGQSLIIPE